MWIFITAINDSLKSSSFNSSHLSGRLQRSDSSFEVIDVEDNNSYTQILDNSLTKKSLRNSLLNPLQSLTQQNKDLKELLEKCINKMASIKEEKQTMLGELEEERNKCKALEEETLRLQVEITSLHKVMMYKNRWSFHFRVLYSESVWRVESLVNLANHLWFTKLKVVVTINNPLADLFSHQTFSAKAWKSKFTEHSPHQTFPLYGTYIASV